ncbi:HK97 family phage prohead protease [Mycobacterium marseillense]|uniref:HK97 family phage prohead protease n=1 Tax=Mycobacterium marseillense TaxID=701042 RepID=UPI0011A81A68|nr:HK97 family phage prohead protease [Mycobacterium marseillense]
MSTLQLRSPSEGAEVLGVDWADRIIRVIVVPYETPAMVEHPKGSGEVWEETFSRTAFQRTLQGVNPETVRVNRDHDKTRTVGKVTRLDPHDQRGLIADIRIAKTLLGDETLALADDDCLSASIGAINRVSGVAVDRYHRTRRVNEAYLDHIALVESPAYAGAQVLSVRSRSSSTPRLDSVANHWIHAWADMRLDPVHRWAQKRLGC